MNNKETASTRWMTPKDLEIELGFSHSTQARLRMDKKIPFSKIGSFIKYDRIEIDKWLENNKIDVRA